MHQRYKHLPVAHNIPGYVVNAHDPTNYDIDLLIPNDMASDYASVITNKYNYFKYDNIFDPHPSHHVGIAYRCRLKGVGVNYNHNTRKMAQLHNDIRNHIDHADGWVLCNLHDIDVYQRLLVEIIVPPSIHINNHLLSLSTFPPIFYDYSNRENRPKGFDTGSISKGFDTGSTSKGFDT